MPGTIPSYDDYTIQPSDGSTGTYTCTASIPILRWEDKHEQDIVQGDMIFSLHADTDRPDAPMRVFTLQGLNHLHARYNIIDKAFAVEFIGIAAGRVETTGYTTDTVLAVTVAGDCHMHNVFGKTAQTGDSMYIDFRCLGTGRIGTGSELWTQGTKNGEEVDMSRRQQLGKTAVYFPRLDRYNDGAGSPFTMGEWNDMHGINKDRYSFTDVQKKWTSSAIRTWMIGTVMSGQISKAATRKDCLPCSHRNSALSQRMMRVCIRPTYAQRGIAFDDWTNRRGVFQPIRP